MVADIDVGVRFATDRKYNLRKFPAELAGGKIVRMPLEKEGNRPPKDSILVQSPCHFYIALLSNYNGKLTITEKQFETMRKDRWVEVHEAFETTVAGPEIWEWRIFKRKVRVGYVNVQSIPKARRGTAIYMFR